MDEEQQTFHKLCSECEEAFKKIKNDEVWIKFYPCGVCRGVLDNWMEKQQSKDAVVKKKNQIQTLDEQKTLF